MITKLISRKDIDNFIKKVMNKKIQRNNWKTTSYFIPDGIINYYILTNHWEMRGLYFYKYLDGSIQKRLVWRKIECGLSNTEPRGWGFWGKVDHNCLQESEKYIGFREAYNFCKICNKKLLDIDISKI